MISRSDTATDLAKGSTGSARLLGVPAGMRRRAMMTPRVVVVLAMLTVSACGDDKDSSPANPTPANTGGRAGGAGTGGSAGLANTGGSAGEGAGGAGGVSQACINCVMGTCMESGTACYTNTDCRAILDCAIAQGCRDQSCAAGCIAQNPAGAALATPAIACVQGSCGTECGLG